MNSSSSEEEDFNKKGSVMSNEGERIDDEEKKIEESNISQIPKRLVQDKNDDFENDKAFEIESNNNNIDNDNDKKDNLNDSAKEIKNENKEVIKDYIKKETEKNEEEKEEKKEEKIEDPKIRPNINYNRGNELILNKKKEVIHMEIDKEKTAQKKYTIYQINLLNDNSNQFNNTLNIKNEKKILCYRRYKDFEKFYNTLKKRFPQYAFPRLSQKDFVKAKVENNHAFIENRRKELQYFINQLYFHEHIGKSEEFKQFLYYSVFDEQYYNNLPKKYSYPECEKVYNNKGYFSLGFDKVSSYFYKSKETNKTEIEKEILSRKEEFINKDTQYNNLLNEIKLLHETAQGEEGEVNQYKILSNNFLYMRDNNSNKNTKSENEYNKNKFNELINVNQRFSEILEDTSIVFLTEIIDKLNYCILDVQGINRAIDRYIEFNEEFKKIQEISVKNNKYIMEEKERAKNDKNEFEKCLSDDIQKYDKKNSQIYEGIIEEIILYLKTINENNDEVFQNSNFIN